MNIFGEYGRVGQNRWNGFISEEFVKELQGRRGIETYKEMAANDSVINAILFAIEMLIRQVKWTVQPGGDTKQDREAAEFVESCLDDMSQTWTDTVSEILSFLTYGWSAHEIVYKRRMGKSKDPQKNSRYNDNLIGWQKLPIRAQESLYEWQFDEETDQLIGMIQMPAPEYRQIEIPVDKLLLFRTKSIKDNPEGRSILRGCYRDWYFKKRIQEIEGIGVERDLAGLPVITAPPDLDIWALDDPDMAKAYTNALRIVTSIKRDNQEGVVLPDGWNLSLLSTGGRRNFDTGSIIERYDSRIAMTVLADFILLGHQQVGSFALSSDKTELFGVALGTFIDVICEEISNRAIPPLIQLNSPKFDKITDFPYLDHSDIETPNLGDMAGFLKEMIGAQVLTPGPKLEEYVREIAQLPAEDEGTERPTQPQDGEQSPSKAEEKPKEKPAVSADGEENPGDPETKAASK